MVDVLGVPVNERCDDDYDNPESKSTFAGLWKHYLAGVWEKPFADRAKICDYNYMDHEEIMRKFAAKVIAEPTVCPEVPNNIRLTEWHP